MSGMELLLSDRNGIYIPQTFAKDFDADSWNIDPRSDDWNTILMGPDAEFYWDSWDAILNSAVHKDSKGNVWTLHQDGDLWGVCVDLMTDEEYEGYFGESRDLDNDEQARWYDTSAELA